MHKQNRSLLFFIFLFALIIKSSAQISATQTVGCEPAFSPVLSGPAGATNVFWNLGPGQGTGTSTSVGPSYTLAGTYLVTYTALVNGSPVNYSISLLVHPKPTGSFSYQIPATHCAPMSVTFAANAGPGINISWAFGDLSGIGSGASNVHSYTFKGSFTPIVILTNAVTGCTNNATNNTSVVVHVSDKPTVHISSSAGWSGCAPPFSSNIHGNTSISNSPLGGNLTFSWQGPSGIPGSVPFGQGTTTITMTATDNNNCSATTTSVVSVVNPTLAVNVQPTVCINGPVPGTITTTEPFVQVSGSALGTTLIKNTVPNTQTKMDTMFIALIKGQQNLSFVVQSQGCPPVTVTKPVFVEEVVPNFVSTPPGSTCHRSMAVTYVNTSSVNSQSSLTFTWSSANGGFSYNQVTPPVIFMNNMGNVTFTASQGSKNPYTIYNYFNPIITLLVQSSSIAKCEAHIKKVILDTVIRPTAYFHMDKREGCRPLTVNFRDTSFYALQFAVPASNYTWCNGGTPSVNGTPSITSVGQQTASFTYTNVGTYYPYLIIESPQGCRDTSFFDTITVVNPPLLNAIFNPVVCANDPFTITMSSTATPVPSSKRVDHWHAETDEGFFSGCITDSTPTWFFTHPGTHSVVITAYQAGCKNTVTLTPTILVKGPVGKFSYETFCGANRSTVTFSVFLDDATGATLDFGDNTTPFSLTGSSGKTSSIVTHTFPQIKDFTVTLTPTHTNGCVPKPFKRVIKLKNPAVSILFDGKPMPVWPEPLACTKSPYMFTATYTDIARSCSRGLAWTYITPTDTLPPMNDDDGFFRSHVHGICPSCAFTIVDPIMLDTFRLAGDYYISVTGRDANGCEVTDSHKFRISNAIPNFTFASNPACFSDNPFQIINNTQSSQYPGDSIFKYTWDWGDGLRDSSMNPFDNPIHSYNMVASPSQIFNVMCIAQNTLGCTDTTIHKFQINNPNPGYSVNQAYPCLPLGKGKSVIFSANQGYATYSVNFGDVPGWSNMPGFNNVPHNYMLPGTYFSTLTVTDAANCKASNVLTITAIGQPTAKITFETGTKFCVPGFPQMKSSSLFNVDSIDQFSFGMKGIQPPPSAQDSLDEPLPTPGTYTVNLIVSIGPYNLCPDTARDVIYVYDTKGKIELDKTTFCLGETITAKATDLNDVAKWQWFFGDLVPQNVIFNTQFAPNPIKYPYVNYPNALGDGKTAVRLTLTSPGDGCVVTLSKVIQVIKINGDFIKTDSIYAHCLGSKDEFKSITTNPHNLVLKHMWDFGDGAQAIGETVSYTYNKAGIFPVNLKIEDTTYFCTGGAVKNMTIFPNPTASLFINDTLVCPRDTFDIHGHGSAGVVSATLTSSTGEKPVQINSDNTFTVQAQVTESDTFALQVTDINGCIAPPDKKGIAVPVPAPEVHTGTTVVIGQTVQINMDAGSIYSYSWTPEVLALDNAKIPNPISTTTADITYTVEIVDEPLHCFLTLNSFSIHVLPLTTVDVPSAFTPNGDGVNDIVYPGGWGIRALNYFRIFNRWGQLVFESTDLTYGWDGTFEGIPQNTETYVWQVEVRTWVDSEPVISKTGTIKLLR